MARDKKEEDTVKKEVAERIRIARAKSGLKQEMVANQLGIVPATYSNYETAKSNPSVPMLYKIANLFNVDVRELIPTNRNPHLLHEPDPKQIDEIWSAINELKQNIASDQ